MCGIAGVIAFEGSRITPEMVLSVRSMIHTIGYRGPDDTQYYQNQDVVLGFKRLSIIDVEGGSQPLYNEDNTIVLICNGEIYNAAELRSEALQRHHFRSNSDCEVIVHLYEEFGTNFVTKLNGMYAFALWDLRNQKLILGRDRFGVKPLFYSVNRERLIFASEIKALLSYHDCPREFDWESALSDPWLSGAPATNLTEPTSYFKQVEHLPAASILEVDLRKKTMKRSKYWTLPSAFEYQYDVSRNPEEYVEEYRNLLEKAVTRCLISDVEVGVFLSGGIDSAAVTAIAASVGKTFHTFTVLSQSTLSNGDAKYAHIIAKELGLPNHQVLFRPGDYPTPEEWKKLLWLCETPFCGPEQLYKYQLHKFSRSVRPSLKVILTGQGSDEFNGGYSTLFAPSHDQSWNGFLNALSLFDRGRHLSRLPISIHSWDRNLPEPILSMDFLCTLSSEKRMDPWYAYLHNKYRDLQMYNCWHEDRTASGNSIENRVPFLDHELVEFTFRVPPDVHRTLFWDKSILRHGMTKYLDPYISLREKVPFFYGSDVKSTHRMMLNIYKQNDFQLIEEAFSECIASSIVNRDSLMRCIEALDTDPEVTNMEFMTRIINMGLLAKMAKDIDVDLDVPCFARTASEKHVTNWDEEMIHIMESLTDGTVLNDDAVVSFRPEISLVPSNDMCVSVNGEIEYLISESESPDLLKFLTSIDGKRSIREIGDVTGLGTARIQRLIDEIKDTNIIEW
ncbi:asparagine synthase (glutamine-hydrolyzing) [Alicyclobacillus suci]|uniref:asparagine synthase (glutamine-hydrolyzing) n=1 Tax=Alicyclobacillus suci TaxID=2816080 RepID=UPI001A8C1800|nr:asparagine synthase (glutamine-hydrolyzing) [Alicyclobacillus suci]